MQIQLRSAAPADEPFLLSLFACDKAIEFASLGWSAQQLQPLLEMQFHARQQSWAQTYPAAVDSILYLEDGKPIGRQLIAHLPDSYRIVDLAVVPEHRSRGVGTWALRRAQELAASDSTPLRLHVARTNVALRLYERLGFARVSEDDLGFEMEWPPHL